MSSKAILKTVNERILKHTELGHYFSGIYLIDNVNIAKR